MPVSKITGLPSLKKFFVKILPGPFPEPVQVQVPASPAKAFLLALWPRDGSSGLGKWDKNQQDFQAIITNKNEGRLCKKNYFCKDPHRG